MAFGVRPRRAVGTPREDAIPVIMCLWGRPDRFARSLEQLAAQEGAPPIRLILWNNKPRNDAHYRAELRAFPTFGAISSVEYVSSRVNIGGIARFIAARAIAPRGSSRPFIMIDDDLDVSTTVVRDLIDAYRPRTYAGWWAFRILGTYWERVEARPGERATYVGTGASICDSALVHERGFFSRLPARWGFIEDLWASAFAASRGWRVEKVETDVELTSEESNQYLKLVDVKPRFWDYLRERLATGRPL
ncbi:hypothetical protein [Microbacterium cremeum]|uniref:hypothetical protein n=1 Tax=Microbacterium cremeum TaxID=2782169 RepID=UPI001888032B|nr:hypothetical protein [Microbacterium cremeum]